MLIMSDPSVMSTGDALKEFLWTVAMVLLVVAIIKWLNKDLGD